MSKYEAIRQLRNMKLSPADQTLAMAKLTRGKDPQIVVAIAQAIGQADEKLQRARLALQNI